MPQTLTARLLYWAPFAVLAAFLGLFIASALGARLPKGVVPSFGDLLTLCLLFLMIQIGTWGNARWTASMADQVQALAEENARLKAEAVRSAREAEQARERLEAEIRSLRLACEELRREHLAQSPSR